jgi:phosphoadenosine phosphosulfate reductase
MDKEQLAIQRFKDAAQMAERAKMGPLMIMDSGGKDSSVLVDLAIKSGVPIEITHSHTTADAPETVYFVRNKFKKLESDGHTVTVVHPTYKGEPISMWTLIPKKLLPPTRTMRYCCDVLKEANGKGRFVATGVRWSESLRRKNSRGIYEIQNQKNGIILNNDNDEKRREFETCQTKGKRIVNPIVDWTDNDVWDYIHANKVPYNPLYDEGCKRVGCVGCPLAGKHRYAEFARWPKYEELYKRSFSWMIEERKKRGMLEGSWRMGDTADDVFHWWMEDNVLQGQMSLEDILDEVED